MKRLLLLALGLLATSSAVAVPITFNFSASGFQNAGTQFPGFSGPLSGSITYEAAGLGATISSLTSISFNLFGHNFSPAEIGIANQGPSETALGALVRGANAVVGDGAADDFLLIFDRFNGNISAFAYSLAGKSGAIWWEPTQVSGNVALANGVPEPATTALLALAILGLGIARQRRAN